MGHFLPYSLETNELARVDYPDDPSPKKAIRKAKKK